MDRGLASGLVAVFGVFALAMLLRRFSGGGSSAGVVPANPDAIADPVEDPDEADADDEAEAIVVTSDGRRFVPMGRQVQLLAPEDPSDRAPGREGEARPSGAERVERLDPGDFTGARVGRGAGGFGPWRLEALGPEGEYIPFPFETEEAAHAALAMLERRGVVRAPRDEDGASQPPSPEQFEEARRRYDETEQELATWADEPLEGDER